MPVAFPPEIEPTQFALVADNLMTPKEVVQALRVHPPEIDPIRDGDAGTGIYRITIPSTLNADEKNIHTILTGIQRQIDLISRLETTKGVVIDASIFEFPSTRPEFGKAQLGILCKLIGAIYDHANKRRLPVAICNASEPIRNSVTSCITDFPNFYPDYKTAKSGVIKVAQGLIADTDKEICIITIPKAEEIGAAPSTKQLIDNITKMIDRAANHGYKYFILDASALLPRLRLIKTDDAGTANKSASSSFKHPAELSLMDFKQIVAAAFQLSKKHQMHMSTVGVPDLILQSPEPQDKALAKLLNAHTTIPAARVALLDIKNPAKEPLTGLQTLLLRPMRPLTENGTGPAL